MNPAIAVRAALALAATLAAVGPLPAQGLAEVKHMYFAPSGVDGWTPQFDFEVRKQGDATRVVGRTGSVGRRLTVESVYGAAEKLRTSRVSAEQHDKAAQVEIVAGKARVVRSGGAAQTFDVPAGVIVTSAPDWTDVVLLCERYDHAKGGKQTFPALWIHPEQPAQLLQLTIERTGYDTVTRGMEKTKVASLRIHLRGQSPYHAWAGLDGTLIRLLPLPAKDARRGLVLQDFVKEGSVLEMLPAK